MCDKCETIGWDSTIQPAISGEQFGIDFYDRPYEVDGVSDQNPQFRVFTEDDELWHFTGLSASIHWLPDLLSVIEVATTRGTRNDGKEALQRMRFNLLAQPDSGKGQGGQPQLAVHLLWLPTRDRPQSRQEPSHPPATGGKGARDGV